MKYGCEESHTFSASAPRQHFERRPRGTFQQACISSPVHTLMGQKKQSDNSPGSNSS